MNKNKILKRFLKLMGFKLEDVLTTEDVISVVTAQVKSKEIKLDDVLTVFDAKNISRDDLHTFVQRVAKQNAWSLYALFGLKDPSLNDVAAKDISKDALKAFVLRTAKKNNWDVKEMFGLPRKPLTITKVEEQPKPETLKFFEDAKTKLVYAAEDGKTLGIVIDKPTVGRFILALNEFAKDMNLQQTNAQISQLPKVDGRKWIVPSDEHFKALGGNLHDINDLLTRLDGDVIYTRGAYLSSTSQANRPQSWHVRLILELD